MISAGREVKKQNEKMFLSRSPIWNIFLKFPKRSLINAMSIGDLSREWQLKLNVIFIKLCLANCKISRREFWNGRRGRYRPRAFGLRSCIHNSVGADRRRTRSTLCHNLRRVARLVNNLSRVSLDVYHVFAMYEAHTINAEHKDLIHDIAYDYYGERMATCSSDQFVKVRWTNGRERFTFLLVCLSSRATIVTKYIDIGYYRINFLMQVPNVYTCPRNIIDAMKCYRFGMRTSMETGI